MLTIGEMRKMAPGTQFVYFPESALVSADLCELETCSYLGSRISTRPPDNAVGAQYEVYYIARLGARGVVTYTGGVDYGIAGIYRCRADVVRALRLSREEITRRIDRAISVLEAAILDEDARREGGIKCH